MFKKLIATCLLTWSCSNGTITTKKENPNKAQYIGSSLVINGTYTFRNEVNVEKLQEIAPNYGILNQLKIEFTNEEENYDMSIFSGHSDTVGSIYRRYNVNRFFVSLNSLLNGTVTMYISTNGESTLDYPSYTITSANVTNLSTIENIESNMTYTNTFNNLQDFVIKFKREYYLSDQDQIALFNAFFTQQGNKYTTFYEGYYHYNNGSWYNSNYRFNYQGFAMFIVNNTICNRYTHNGGIVAYGVKNVYENQEMIVILSDGNYSEVSNVNINGLLPKYVRDCMNSEGVFAYINDSQPTTWYEMILSTMDAPIYYLQSLFNFELFGMNLFIAFSSLLTLVVVLTIVKKVW